MPHISVIIPTYNRAHCISRALESIFNQTYQDFEVLVVDDGSVDETDSVMNQWLQKYPDKLRYFSQENQGSAAARNKGIQEAEGEFICFLDSDDEWLPQKLERQMECFMGYADKGRLGVIFGDMMQFSNGNLQYERFLRRDFYIDVFKRNIYQFSTFLEACYIFLPTVFIPKGIFKQVGLFNIEYRSCQDYELLIRIFRNYDVIFLDEVLIKRHFDKDSITRNQEAHLTNLVKIFSRLSNDQSLSKFENKIVRRRLTEFHRQLGRYYFDQRRFREAKSNLVKSFFSRHCISVIYFWILASLPEKLFYLLKSFKNKYFDFRRTSEKRS